MQAFFRPDQLLHDPQPSMRLGRRLRALDLPTVVGQEGGHRVEALGPGLRALPDGLGA